MQVTHRSILNLNPLLTQAARTAHVFPHLQSGALISIGKLCNDGCIATFTAAHISVVKDGLTVLEVNRSSTYCMWQINLTSNPISRTSQQQLVAINDLAARSNPYLVKWYHTALFIPVNKTLLQVIRNVHFTTWTNLTVELMKHLPTSVATAKVHMKHIRKNIKSTKTQVTPPNKDEPMETLETRSNHVFSGIIDPQQ